MRISLIIIILLFSLWGRTQNSTPSDYGYRHLQMTYSGDTVEILIRSKKGEEQLPKPIFLFCQGSLPVPLIIQYNLNGEQKIYPVFVFNPDILSRDYHLAIVGKPYTPLMAHEHQLKPDHTYTDSAGKFARKYVERNLLDYYVKRNIAVLDFLRSEPWVAKERLIVAGHSEGSAIAAKLASDYPAVTAVIYSGGNPLGRMMSLASRARASQKDSSQAVPDIFDYWKTVMTDVGNMDGPGDTFRSMYQFSYPPPMDYLKKVRVPVLVTFGEKDYGAVTGIDYLRMEAIRLRKHNFTFKEYPDTDHNFFPLKQNGEPDYDRFNWDKVAEDWGSWLRKNEIK